MTDVACTLGVSWDDGLVQYDFGPGHPLAPVRVELTIALARSFGIFDYPSVTVTTTLPSEVTIVTSVPRMPMVAVAAR